MHLVVRMECAILIVLFSTRILNQPQRRPIFSNDNLLAFIDLFLSSFWYMYIGFHFISNLEESKYYERMKKNPNEWCIVRVWAFSNLRLIVKWTQNEFPMNGIFWRARTHTFTTNCKRAGRWCLPRNVKIINKRQIAIGEEENEIVLFDCFVYFDATRTFDSHK